MVLLHKLPDLKKRHAHFYPQCLGLVAARYDTAVVVAEHNNGTIAQCGVESPLARNKEVITVYQGVHLSVL
jgi:hypothetical protein